MAIKLKQSTASQEIPLGYFVDATDGNTEETGLTIANTDIKLWKAGATTLANKNSGGATHIANGIYYCVLDATDTDTLGSLVIFVHVAGALSIRIECVVLAANIYDSLIAASDNLQVDAVQIEGVDATNQINAEVVDVLTVDTQAEPTGAPAANATLAQKIGYLFAALRNKLTVAAAAKTFYDDAGASLWSKSLTDDGTTYTENEGS